MRNYFRAIRLSFRHKYTIIASVLCALLIGLFWGANISIVYPFVEISFDGKTVVQWLNEKIALNAKDRTRIENEMARRQGVDLPPLENDEDKAKRIRLEAKTDLHLETELYVLKRWEKFYSFLHPWALKYAPKDPFVTVAALVAFVFVGTILKAILIYIHGILIIRISSLCAIEIRRIFFSRLIEYDVNYFSREGVTDSMSRLTGDVGTLTAGLGILYGKLVREPMKLIVCLIGAAIVSWQLLLLTLTLVPLAAFLISWLAKSIRRVVRRTMEEMSTMFGRIEESLRSIRVVKAYTREGHEKGKFRHTNLTYFNRVMKSAKYDALASPMTELLGMSMICIAILAGAYLVMYEQTSIFGIPMSRTPMSLGALLTFFAMLAGASDPARRLADIFTQFQSAAAAADRVYDRIDRIVPFLEVENPKRLPKHHDVISFENVCFEYEKGHPVLKNVSFSVRFGETLAIIGPSGCGKSTLINLLLRFADPTSGAINIDGVPIKEAKLLDLRRQIGYVTQEPVLFNDTVYNNIKYGNPYAEKESVVDAAKRANAHSFIEAELINGYETEVGAHGGLLSGGQRQRIAIARAIVRNPAIFLMDEATSQIDLNSEKIIHEALSKDLGNRTTILVTHRLSALSLADRIMIINDGEILDLGTHKELMQRCPFYVRLRQTEMAEQETS